MSQVIIQSYVFHGAKCWLVSTIDRKSSAAQGPLRYYETLVWECDLQTRERGRLIHEAEDARGSIHQHLRISRELIDNGAIPNPHSA